LIIVVSEILFSCCVFLAHSTEIWQATQALELPHTLANIAYGTPEMAEAINQLFQSEQLQQHSLFTIVVSEILFSCCVFLVWFIK
jgi:hypothetical protein